MLTADLKGKQTSEMRVRQEGWSQWAPGEGISKAPVHVRPSLHPGPLPHRPPWSEKAPTHHQPRGSPQPVTVQMEWFFTSVQARQADGPNIPVVLDWPLKLEEGNVIGPANPGPVPTGLVLAVHNDQERRNIGGSLSCLVHPRAPQPH